MIRQEFKRGSSNDGQILIAKHICNSVLQCFTVSFKFYSTFVTLLFSQFNGLYKSIKVKIRKDLQSVFPPWLTHFPVAKVLRVQWGSVRNMDTIMQIPVAHGYPHLLYSKN